MIKDKKVAFGLFVAVVVIFWNILEFLYGTFITHNGYTFSMGTGVMLPLGLSLVVGYLLILRRD